MSGIVVAPDTQHRLEALSDASRFDLSCACGSKTNDDHRRRGSDGVWLYPVALPSGGTSVMLKTLLSNSCVSDCRYCPFRCQRDVRRHSLTPEEVVRVFLDYSTRLGLIGLFLSSGIVRDADHTMERLARVARTLRRTHGYGGFIHLKVIPGASDAAIEDVVSVANVVSLNVEVPTRTAFSGLSATKDFERDIVRPMKLISRLTGRGMSGTRGVNQSTQFIVGAAGERDGDIVKATGRLYDRWGLCRVYYSAYQRGLGDPSLHGERHPPTNGDDALTREHRLYQVDFLLRKYGFGADEIPFESDGNLSLDADPKEVWAQRHPERFPLNVNRAEREELLRVPGLGPVTVTRILERRGRGGRLSRLSDIGKPGKRLAKAERYLRFN